MSPGNTPPAANPYRRPAAQQGFLDRAARDWELLGQVEKILARQPEVLVLMVKCEPAKYAQFLAFLAGLVERHVAIVDAATEAHGEITAALCVLEASESQTSVKSRSAEAGRSG